MEMGLRMVALGAVAMAIGLSLASAQSISGNFSSAAVSFDAGPCAQVAADVLASGGFAVDGAVAAFICGGVYHAQAAGIGGGVIMTIYTKATGEAVTLMAREAAPAYAHKDMFDGDQLAAQLGPLASAIPGEVRGLFEAKERYGNPAVSWASLLQPTIDMCRNGITVSRSMASALVDKTPEIFNDPGLKATFVDPETNEVYKEGDVYTRENLAVTLERIARNGADEFYSGLTARRLIADIREAGGNMTLQDLQSYRTSWTPALTVSLGSGLSLHVPPAPSSGPILAYILNVLKHYELTPVDNEDLPLLSHRIAEAFKWAYAARTKMGDPLGDPEIADFVNELVANLTSDWYALETFSKIDDSFTVNNASYYGADFYTPADSGTSHLSIIAPNGDSVSATSTINLSFGSKFLSPATGIIMNNEMDDFSYPNITNDFGVPPSPNNFVLAGKRPMSSMCPAIVTRDDGGDVRLAVGGAGGTSITTASALVSISNLWLGADLLRAVDAPRIHHQLAPMHVEYETMDGGVDQSVLAFLSSVGHEVAAVSASGVIGAASAEDGSVFAVADKRKAGGVAGF